MSTLKRWTLKEARALFDMPFLDLVFQAQQVHRQHFGSFTNSSQHLTVDKNRRLS